MTIRAQLNSSSRRLLTPIQPPGLPRLRRSLRSARCYKASSEWPIRSCSRPAQETITCQVNPIICRRVEAPQTTTAAALGPTAGMSATSNCRMCRRQRRLSITGEMPVWLKAVMKVGLRIFGFAFDWCRNVTVSSVHPAVKWLDGIGVDPRTYTRF